MMKIEDLHKSVFMSQNKRNQEKYKNREKNGYQ
jgi:hypothetical protein